MKKNREFLCGNERAAKRLRFQPDLGHVSARRVKTWITARWFDDAQKNDQAQNILYGQLEVVSEILCLGYTPRFVRRSLSLISEPEWRNCAKRAKSWCKLVGQRGTSDLARESLRELMIGWRIDM